MKERERERERGKEISYRVSFERERGGEEEGHQAFLEGHECNKVNDVVGWAVVPSQFSWTMRKN